MTMTIKVILVVRVENDLIVIVIVIIGFTVQTCYMYGICVRMHDYKMAVHTER